MSRFRKFLASNVQDFDIIPLGTNTVRYATAVMDKNIENYRIVQNKEKPVIRMYTSATLNKVGYSQFHFGAGEASVIEQSTVSNLPRQRAYSYRRSRKRTSPSSSKALRSIFTGRTQTQKEECPALPEYAFFLGEGYPEAIVFEYLRK